jgi:flavodoxin
MKVVVIYASRGNSAKVISEYIKDSLQLEALLVCVNGNNIDAAELDFDHLILVCPTYGDEELEIEMELFLTRSNWFRHKNSSFSVCELGLYRGYLETTMGAGKIISDFLISKGLVRKGSLLSVETMPINSFLLINKWVKGLI